MTMTSYWQQCSPTADGNKLFGDIIKFTVEVESISEYKKKLDAFFDCGMWVELDWGCR